VGLKCIEKENSEGNKDNQQTQIKNEKVNDQQATNNKYII